MYFSGQFFNPGIREFSGFWWSLEEFLMSKRGKFPLEVVKVRDVFLGTIFQSRDSGIFGIWNWKLAQFGLFIEQLKDESSTVWFLPLDATICHAELVFYEIYPNLQRFLAQIKGRVGKCSTKNFRESGRPSTRKKLNRDYRIGIIPGFNPSKT